MFCVVMKVRFAVVLASVVPLVAGCGEDRSKPKYVTREGQAEGVDPNGGFSMSFVNDKGESKLVEGELGAEAEVLINGRQAEITDIHTGDRVKVTGYVEGEKMNRRFVAVKVEVTRETYESTSAPAATQTTTKPGAGGAAKDAGT